MSDELKVVIALKGERGIIGIQSPDCDPHIHTFEGGLAHALESIPGLVEEARAAWVENPRYPKCETPLTPPPTPASQSTRETQRAKSPQQSLF